MLYICLNSCVIIPTWIWLWSMHMQNLIKFHPFVHKILSENKILTITKGHHHVGNLQKLTHNNPNLDLINVSAYATFGLIPSIHSQDIELKLSLNDRIMESENHMQNLTKFHQFFHKNLCGNQILT